MPWPKGAPTAPEFIHAHEEHFGDNLTALHATLEEFVASGDSARREPHPAFGQLSGKAWGRLVYRHLDHHLRQFGHLTGYRSRLLLLGGSVSRDRPVAPAPSVHSYLLDSGTRPPRLRAAAGGPRRTFGIDPQLGPALSSIPGRRVARPAALFPGRTDCRSPAVAARWSIEDVGNWISAARRRQRVRSADGCDTFLSVIDPQSGTTLLQVHDERELGSLSRSPVLRHSTGGLFLELAWDALLFFLLAGYGCSELRT